MLTHCISNDNTSSRLVAISALTHAVTPIGSQVLATNNADMRIATSRKMLLARCVLPSYTKLHSWVKMHCNEAKVVGDQRLYHAV
jgi:hypothetical protein